MSTFLPAVPPSLLVVDDDFGIRETLRDLLEIEGFHVDTAENGAEALRKIRHGFRPALVLLDLIMPVMGGREFLDMILSDPKISGIPVLIISATVDDDNRHGAVGALKKPIDMDELLARIRHHTCT